MSAVEQRQDDVTFGVIPLRPPQHGAYTAHMILDGSPRTYYPGSIGLASSSRGFYPNVFGRKDLFLDEIPRTYYPGRGFLTDQEAYPQNSFYRTPRYSGGLNIPGAPGNIQTLPYFGEPLNPTQMPYYPGQDYGGVQQLAQAPANFDRKYVS